MPEARSILQRVPDLKPAMFSILEPGKHVLPHRDPYDGVLRLYLGLSASRPTSSTGCCSASPASPART